MKTTIRLFLFSFVIVLFTNCSNDDDTIAPAISGIWNVSNVSGGLAGINDDYDPGVIVWNFNNRNQTLVVTNNNTENVIYDGYPSGTYTYSVTVLDGKSYLTVGNNEFGRITFETNTATLNQNELSGGAGADGFMISLVR